MSPASTLGRLRDMRLTTEQHSSGNQKAEEDAKKDTSESGTATEASA